MSELEPKEKEEKVKKQIDWKALDSFEANAHLWRERQESLMMSLRPWLNIQADLARHAETAERIAELAAQAEQHLMNLEQHNQIQESLARLEAAASSIRLPEIPSTSLIVDAMKKADVDVEELVAVIQKQKAKLKLKDEEIAPLKRFIAEGRKKKPEYIE